MMKLFSLMVENKHFSTVLSHCGTVKVSEGNLNWLSLRRDFKFILSSRRPTAVSEDLTENARSNKLIWNPISVLSGQTKRASQEMVKTLSLGELKHLCMGYASKSILYHHKKANFSERTVKLYQVTPVLICNVTLQYAMQRLLGISLSDQLIVALRLLNLFVNI